jgi:hypothetical protein
MLYCWIFVGLIALMFVVYAYKTRNASYNAFLQRSLKNDFLVNGAQSITPAFYAAFCGHYHRKNQIVFENEKLLNDFLVEYNRIFWGKNTGLDFILAENIDTCNYQKTEKQYKGMMFVGNSYDSIPKGYEFASIFIFEYKVRK